MNRYLVTGAADFIGANLAQALLDAGCEVVGVDSLNAVSYTHLTLPTKA